MQRFTLFANFVFSFSKMAADSAFEANENSLILLGCARKAVDGLEVQKTSVMVFGKSPFGGVA